MNTNNSNTETTRASDDLFKAILIGLLLGPIAAVIPFPFTGVIWFGIISTMFIYYLYLSFVFEPITEDPYSESQQYISDQEKSNNTNNTNNNSTNYQTIKSKTTSFFSDVFNFIKLIPYLISSFFSNEFS